MNHSDTFSEMNCSFINILNDELRNAYFRAYCGKPRSSSMSCYHVIEFSLWMRDLAVIMNMRSTYGFVNQCNTTERCVRRLSYTCPVQYLVLP